MFCPYGAIVNHELFFYTRLAPPEPNVCRKIVDQVKLPRRGNTYSSLPRHHRLRRLQHHLLRSYNNRFGIETTLFPEFGLLTMLDPLVGNAETFYGGVVIVIGHELDNCAAESTLYATVFYG